MRNLICYVSGFKQDRFLRCQTQEKVEENYAYDILADDALFELAGIYETNYKNTAKAMEYYERLMANYPGSTYVVEARKKYRTLRGDDLN